jgi:UV DNA damage endonuclease
VCERLSIPLVLDWHHDALNPSSEPPQAYLDRIEAIWQRRGIRPKQHYSESRPGANSTLNERRAHSDRVKNLPPCAVDMDLMIEAKEKEQAVFDLYRRFDLHPVDDNVHYQAGNAPTVSKKRKSAEPKKSEASRLDEAFPVVKSASRPKRSCVRK